MSTLFELEEKTSGLFYQFNKKIKKIKNFQPSRHKWTIEVHSLLLYYSKQKFQEVKHVCVADRICNDLFAGKNGVQPAVLGLHHSGNLLQKQ